TTVPSAAESGVNLADRRSRISAMLTLRASTSEQDASWAHEKFITRARALFYARMAFLTIGLALLAVPAWGYALGVRGHMGFVVYFAMLFYSVANFLVVEHPVVGVRATFVTLCLDLLVVVYL